MTAIVIMLLSLTVTFLGYEIYKTIVNEKLLDAEPKEIKKITETRTIVQKMKNILDKNNTNNGT